MNHCHHIDNLVLTGMPGVGKSTVGVLLAKATSKRFIDTDILIQSREGHSLQDIIDWQGPDAFREIEKKHILSLRLNNHVIATGGSVVYYDEAMRSLSRNGLVIYLELPFDSLAQRVRNLTVRGVVMTPGQSFRDLYEEREPLYRQWAHLIIRCGDRTQDQVVEAIGKSLLDFRTQAH